MTNDKFPIKSQAPNPKLQKIKINNNPVAISTSGYCQDIFSLHFRHLPPNHKKLTIGMRSYQTNTCPHFTQCERFFTIPSPVSRRQITTFKKLPMAEPKRKIIASIISLICPIGLIRLIPFYHKNKNHPKNGMVFVFLHAQN